MEKNRTITVSVLDHERFVAAGSVALHFRPPNLDGVEVTLVLATAAPLSEITTDAPERADVLPHTFTASFICSTGMPRKIVAKETVGGAAMNESSVAA